jgi:putative aldouronate transport system permease protein
MAIACLIPFWLLIAASFSDESDLYNYGYSFWPHTFSLEAYHSAMMSGNIFKAYQVSIGITVAGTLLGLFIMMMAAYAIQRKEFRYRNKIAFYFYFTTLFSGGLVPYYVLMTKYLNLKNNYLALILPALMSPWLIILLRTYIQTIPEALTESAKLDGASDFGILLRIIIPLAKPGLATIGLFLALNYWNDWYNASLFLMRKSMYPLQYYLQNVILNAEFARSLAGTGVNVDLRAPTESLKMATAAIATGPIVLLYPFVQKYFVKGIIIGAVKG